MTKIWIEARKTVRVFENWKRTIMLWSNFQHEFVIGSRHSISKIAHLSTNYSSDPSFNFESYFESEVQVLMADCFCSNGIVKNIHLSIAWGAPPGHWKECWILSVKRISTVSLVNCRRLQIELQPTSWQVIWLPDPWAETYDGWIFYQVAYLL